MRVTPGVSGEVNNSAATVAAAACADSSADRMNSLEKTVHKLGEKIEQLMVSPRPDSYNSSNNTGRINSSCVCCNCSATGHIRRRCNLASGQGDRDATCQLCSQRGHTAAQCKLFVNNQNTTNPGNANTPRNTGRGPLGGQY